MKNILDKLRKLYKIDKIRDIFLQVLEAVIAILTGGYIGAWISIDENKVFDKKELTIFLLILTVIFLIFRLLRQFYLPESTIDYIENQLEIEKKQRELNRKKTIDNYIDNAIKTLNENTCPLDGSSENNLCDLNLELGLKDVLKDITQNTNYILDCNTSKFTICLYLSNYPNHNDDFNLNYSPKSILLRDNFNLSEYFPDNILSNSNVIELQFQLYANAISALNHNKLIEIEDNENNMMLLFCPIPAICEGSSSGIIFIIAEKCIKPPSDLENTLFIFGRILSNWVSKYESCVLNRNQAKNFISISNAQCPDCEKNINLSNEPKITGGLSYARPPK